MQNYRQSAHATYDLKYRIVWITKYRKKVLGGQIGERTRELIRQVYKNNEIEIIAEHVSKDHVHLLVSVLPHLSVSKTVQYIKGYSSRKLLMEYKELNKEFLGHHLWARGYFAASSGNVTDEVIIEYIAAQEIDELQKQRNHFKLLQQQLQPTCFKRVVVELFLIVNSFLYHLCISVFLQIKNLNYNFVIEAF